jgi:thiol:disulfide interchange protein
MSSRPMIFLGGLLLVAIPAAGLQPPAVSLTRLSDVKVPDAPYDESANADAAVSRALITAGAARKRVLIDLGANWCADCRILAGIMQTREIRRFVDNHYVVVLVDVGRINRNMQVPRRFGITQPLNGVPALLVVDASGNLLNKGQILELGFARSMTPRVVAQWLAHWAE